MNHRLQNRADDGIIILDTKRPPIRERQPTTQEECIMKKILSVLLVLAALLAMATSAALAAEIALVTDVGTIDDESFNQACWEGVKAYAEANGKTYQYYQPGADSTDERLNSIDLAVSEGAKVVVCPGYLFGETVAQEISALTGKRFVTAPNKLHALTSKDELVYLHGAFKALAADLMKIANDVRLLASGPRCGIGELLIPENEPGSSIMPGKVNPTQCEALTMVACRVHGNQAAVSMASSQGRFELNVYAPILADSFIESVKLLSEAIHSFDIHCAQGIQVNEDRMEELVEKSLMLVTALSPHIGYEKSAKIAKKAFADNSSLKEAALDLGYVTEEEYDRWVDAKEMTNVDR